MNEEIIKEELLKQIPTLEHFGELDLYVEEDTLFVSVRLDAYEDEDNIFEFTISEDEPEREIAHKIARELPLLVKEADYDWLRDAMEDFTIDGLMDRLKASAFVIGEDTSISKSGATYDSPKEVDALAKEIVDYIYHLSPDEPISAVLSALSELNEPLSKLWNDNDVYLV